MPKCLVIGHQGFRDHEVQVLNAFLTACHPDWTADVAASEYTGSDPRVVFKGANITMEDIIAFAIDEGYEMILRSYTMGSNYEHLWRQFTDSGGIALIPLHGNTHTYEPIPPHLPSWAIISGGGDTRNRTSYGPSFELWESGADFGYSNSQSFSSPIVAAKMTRYLAQGLSVLDARQAMRQFASFYDDPGWTPEDGYGRPAFPQEVIDPLDLDLMPPLDIEVITDQVAKTTTLRWTNAETTRWARTVITDPEDNIIYQGTGTEHGPFPTPNGQYEYRFFSEDASQDRSRIGAESTRQAFIEDRSVFHDYFDGANGDPIGSAWTVSAGQATIQSGSVRLRMTSAQSRAEITSHAPIVDTVITTEVDFGSRDGRAVLYHIRENLSVRIVAESEYIGLDVGTTESGSFVPVASAAVDASGAAWEVQIEAVGSEVRVRAWPAGGALPVGWALTTQVPIGAGMLGVEAARGSAGGTVDVHVARVIATPGTPEWRDPYTLEMLRDEPRALWKMDETSGADILNAFGARYGDLEAQGGITHVPGRRGFARDFPGGTGSVALSPFEADRHDGEFTVGAWVYLRAGATTQQALRIVGAGGGDFPNLYGWYLYLLPNGSMAFYIDEGVQSGRWSSAHYESFPIGEWTYVMGAVRNGRAEVWVNGDRVIAPEPNLPLEMPGGLNERLHFGASNALSIAIDGILDETAIFHAALSEERILAHFAALEGVEAVSALQEVAVTGSVDTEVIDWMVPATAHATPSVSGTVDVDVLSLQQVHASAEYAHSVGLTAEASLLDLTVIASARSEAAITTSLETEALFLQDVHLEAGREVQITCTLSAYHDSESETIAATARAELGASLSLSRSVVSLNEVHVSPAATIRPVATTTRDVPGLDVPPDLPGTRGRKLVAIYAYEASGYRMVAENELQADGRSDLLHHLATPVSVRGRLGHPDELTLTILQGSPWQTERPVPARSRLRLVYSDGSETLWRVRRTTTPADGESAAQIHAWPLWTDLDSVLWRRRVPGGTTRNVALVGVTAAEALEAVISAESGVPSTFEPGYIFPALRDVLVNIQAEHSTPLSLIHQICEQAPAEMDVRYENERILIDIVPEIGWTEDERTAGAGDPDLRPIDDPSIHGESNRRRLTHDEDQDAYYSRIVPLAIEGQDTTSLRDMWWRVTGGGEPVGNRVTIEIKHESKSGFNVPFYNDLIAEHWALVFEDDTYNRIASATADGDVTIVGNRTVAEGQYVRLVELLSGLDEGLVSDAVLAEIDYVVDEAAESERGLKVAVREFSAPPYENLLARTMDGGNPASADMSSAPGPLEAPYAWFSFGGASVQRVTGNLVTHGAAAVRVTGGAGSGLSTVPVAMNAAGPARSPYASAWASVRIESGSATMRLLDLATGEYFPPETDSQVDLRAGDDAGLAAAVAGMIPSGDVVLSIEATSPDTSMVIDAATITASHGAYEYAPEMGMAAIYAQAAHALMREGGVQPRRFSAELWDVSQYTDRTDVAEIVLGSWVTIRSFPKASSGFDSVVIGRVSEIDDIEDTRSGRIEKRIRVGEKKSFLKGLVPGRARPSRTSAPRSSAGHALTPSDIRPDRYDIGLSLPGPLPGGLLQFFRAMATIEIEGVEARLQSAPMSDVLVTVSVDGQTRIDIDFAAGQTTGEITTTLEEIEAGSEIRFEAVTTSENASGLWVGISAVVSA